MQRATKFGLFAGLVLVLGLSLPGAAVAANGGNSANAKLCQKGGWQDWVRADQTPFNNQDVCVSYGAHGGTLTEPAAGPTMDRAYCAPAGPPTLGAGDCFVPGIWDIDFDASSGPLGESPTGSSIFESLPFHHEANVTCLQVTGNVASIGGAITTSTSLTVGTGWSFTVTDNGPGATDTMSDITLSASAPTADTPDCGSSSGGSIGDLSGDIVVVDA